MQRSCITNDIIFDVFLPYTSSKFKEAMKGRTLCGWLASRSKLSHAFFRGTKSGQSIRHRNQSAKEEAA